MSKIIAFFGGNIAFYGIAALVIALSAFGVVQTLRLSASSAALSKEKLTASNLRTEAADRRAQVATLTKEASENARKIENEKAKKAKEIVDAVAVEKSNTVAAIAAHRADVRGLRKQLNDYASSGGAGSSTANAGPGLDIGQKAARLGDVLATCADETLSDAGDLEDLATQVRGLQNYWGLTGDHK